MMGQKLVRVMQALDDTPDVIPRLIRTRVMLRVGVDLFKAEELEDTPERLEQVTAAITDAIGSEDWLPDGIL